MQAGQLHPLMCSRAGGLLWYRKRQWFGTRSSRIQAVAVDQRIGRIAAVKSNVAFGQ